MKLFEHQAKDVFSEYGIKIPENNLLDTVDKRKQPDWKNGYPAVVKAQVLHGGRGKAGLIKVVNDEQKLREEINRIHEITQKSILLEQGITFKQEFYLSITMEPVSGDIVIISSSEGGIDIEETAKNSPEKIIRKRIDPFFGILPHDGNDIAFALGLSEKDLVKKFGIVLTNLFHVFTKEEASLAEINPLVIDVNNEFIALDAKLTIDDGALFRHPRYEMTREYYDGDFEYEAAQTGVPFIKFDGEIGMMVAGAGLANVIFDLIHYHGGTVANYLEFGGPNYRKGKECLKMMLDLEPKVILIVTFGTIARADIMAEGVVAGVKEYQPTIPIVCSIKGTGEEKAKALLAEVGIVTLSDSEEAVEKAVALVKGS